MNYEELNKTIEFSFTLTDETMKRAREAAGKHSWATSESHAAAILGYMVHQALIMKAIT